MVNLLIIDDDQNFLDSLRRSLPCVKPAWHFYFANSVKAAIGILEGRANNIENLTNEGLENKPDIIICDVIMPDMNGFAFLEYFRHQYSQSWDIPFIFLTGNYFKDEVIKGQQAGVDDYLTKPIDRDVLVSKIEMHLARIERLRKAEGIRNIYNMERQRATHDENLQNLLSAGLKNDEFKVLYQPKINSTGQTVGAEALVRWMPDSTTMIPPSIFIGAAEKSHLILPLTERVQEIVIRDVSGWKQQGHENIRVAINTSSLHYQTSGFNELVDRLPDNMTSNISYEITEREVVGNLDQVRSQINNARDKGIMIYIDDFGIGQSSLSYLKNLPVTGIKIDKTFVDDSENSQTGRLLLENIIQLGKIFELNVVAEGAEKKEQVEMLFDLGCNEIQGFYFSKPLHKNDFTAFIKDHKKF